MLINMLKYSLLKRKVRNRHGSQVANTVSDLMDEGRYTPGFWSLVDGKPVWSNKDGAVGVKLKYRHIKGFELFLPIPIGASEVVKAASGRFCNYDASGRAEILDDAGTDIIGHLEFHDATASATEGADIGLLNLALDAIYRIPVNAGTYAAAMRWNTTDLARTSNVQGAKLDASGEDLVQIVDGDVDNNNWVDVRINPNKIAITGVV